MGCLVRRRSLRQANDLGDTLRWNRGLSGRTGPVAKQAANALLKDFRWALIGRETVADDVLRGERRAYRKDGSSK